MREHGSLFVRVSRLKGDNITGCDGVISMDDLTRQAFAYQIKYCRRMIRSHAAFRAAGRIAAVNAGRGPQP